MAKSRQLFVSRKYLEISLFRGIPIVSVQEAEGVEKLVDDESHGVVVQGGQAGQDPAQATIIIIMD